MSLTELQRPELIPTPAVLEEAEAVITAIEHAFDKGEWVGFSATRSGTVPVEGVDVRITQSVEVFTLDENHMAQVACPIPTTDELLSDEWFGANLGPNSAGFYQTTIEILDGSTANNTHSLVSTNQDKETIFDARDSQYHNQDEPDYVERKTSLLGWVNGVLKGSPEVSTCMFFEKYDFDVTPRPEPYFVTSYRAETLRTSTKDTDPAVEYRVTTCLHPDDDTYEYSQVTIDPETGQVFSEALDFGDKTNPTVPTVAELEVIRALIEPQPTTR